MLVVHADKKKAIENSNKMKTIRQSGSSNTHTQASVCVCVFMMPMPNTETHVRSVCYTGYLVRLSLTCTVDDIL